MISSARRSAGKRRLRTLADGGAPLILGAALACVLAACAPAAADIAGGQAAQHGAFSCRGPAPRHKIAKAYVTGNTGLTVIDLATGKAGKLKPFRDEQVDIVVSPDRRTAYADTPYSVVPIDVATNAVGRPIPVPAGAAHIAIAPGGRTLYAAGDGGITPVSLRTCTTGRVIPVPAGAASIAIAPGGRTLYAIGDGGITPVSLRTRTTGRVITIPSFEVTGPLAITADGRTAYLFGNLERDDGTSATGFLRIDLARGIAGKFLPVPVFDDAAISPDGRTAYLLRSPSLLPVSLVTGKLGKPVKLPGLGGSRIVITRNGRTAYVGSIKPLTPNSGVITPVDLRASTAGQPIHVPSYPFSIVDIAIAADGRTAYATNTTSFLPVDLATRKAGKPITVDGAGGITLTS